MALHAWSPRIELYHYKYGCIYVICCQYDYVETITVLYSNHTPRYGNHQTSWVLAAPWVRSLVQHRVPSRRSRAVRFRVRDTSLLVILTADCMNAYVF
jgi:hypothetical protein